MFKVGFPGISAGVVSQMSGITMDIVAQFKRSLWVSLEIVGFSN